MRLVGAVPLTGAEKQKRYRERHPEKVHTAKGVWALANPEKFREGERRRNREYEKRHPGRNLVRNAKFRTTPKGIACYLYWNANRRSRVNGIEFSLTKEWILEKVKNGKCEITGISFSFDNGRKPFAPSLDRINPGLGYTEDNVKVVVWIYNLAKNNFSHEDVLKMANALVEVENEIS